MTVYIKNIDAENVKVAWDMFQSLCKEQGTEKFIESDFEKFKNMLCAPDTILKGLIAQSNGQYVGMVLYFFGASPYKAAPFLSFKGMYVDPLSRKNGIAKALMREMHKKATEKECCYIQWNVVKENEGAISYYNHFGFSHDTDPLLEYGETLDSFIIGLNE
ncbi:MAG: GNAT family N-acetyltransferase [Alphaproteobacteria bacterium]|nr:GNAT family N-acetyltransferase [Alphaproteobacteria bacterium]MCB9984169.1 GNAT family N-acetyltransferase [Micavibrio sp.]HPQ50966.1 GNAT family N-acetyltransferase [Alphaproteobacteria bacterium]